MMRFFGSIGSAYLLVIVACAILATRMFYPHHRFIALSVYAISWIPFLFSLWTKRQWIEQHEEIVRGFFFNYGWHVLLFLIFIAFAYVAWTLFPIEKSPLSEETDTELLIHLMQDADTILYLDGMMKETVKAMDEEDVFHRKNIGTLNSGDNDRIRDMWAQFVETSFELDLLKRRYRAFYQVDVLTKPRIHSEAFLLAYAAFLSQHTSVLRLTHIVSENEFLITIFNEPDDLRGIPKDAYVRMKQLLTHPDEILRLSAGRGYLELTKKNLQNQKELMESVQKQLAGIDSSLTEYPKLMIQNPLDLLEKKTFSIWFPLQKNVALQLSYIRTAARDYLISPTVINEYVERFIPGDILLQRREWHATNIGIPGYWTHLALYTGTLEEMDQYFDGLSLFEGDTASEYLRKHYPKAYGILAELDQKNFLHRIIEAKRPGVIFASLEESANADSLAILRPRVTKEERFQALTASFIHLGKPYDYNFDFRTDNALVCSELIYKAYQDIAGLHLQPLSINGRTVFPPNLLAQKFDEEYATELQQMDLVLFLDGNEKEKTVIERGVEDFRETWQRPKWHILENYVHSS